ncbi:MAG: nitrate reductase [Gammaproteobacteria bacterium]|nr:nitrate reductase [Gammaproteobacteria bacterium]
MTLLELARGPALQTALAVFVIGVLWRLLGVVFLRHKKDHSEPRHGGLRPWIGGLKLIITRSWPHKEFTPRTAFSETVGYLFHIGLAVVVLAYVPHILFIEDLFGVGWPGLPNALIYATGLVTLFLLVVALGRRLHHPVLRMLSNFDDYFSWTVTVLPLITGFLAVAHLGARYETLLAWHILSFELLLVWFPFGKLMHAFFFFLSRGAAGYAYERKGASS